MRQSRSRSGVYLHPVYWLFPDFPCSVNSSRYHTIQIRIVIIHKVDTLSHSTTDALRPSTWDARWVSGTSDGLGTKCGIVPNRPRGQTNEMSSREPLDAHRVLIKVYAPAVSTLKWKCRGRKLLNESLTLFEAQRVIEHDGAWTVRIRRVRVGQLCWYITHPDMPWS